ncbi:expressed protein [Phakopsora pachyrhizi]|uniref:Expressed protein n=1 Tax=Phakopsora pachyrhizi TaxID=170000 RepID=A0AAV0BL00_PHAPC|nr:expressed protein [Phakopsora pachyrhizi]
MVGTFGSHWKSKLRSDKKSDWVLVNREGESRVRRIEFDIFPWSDSEEDRMTALMLKQLKKFLIKEELKDSDVCCSKVKVCACTTGLAGGRTIKLNSTRLLETIASSHRNLRKKEISSTFKTLRDSDISLIFPLSSTRSLDLVLLWRTTDSQRIGHHYLSDLKFGSTVDVSQREQKALLGQWKRSEYGRMEDPIRVELEVENDFFDWNFKRDGPFILKVKFIIKNLSTTNEASYDLDLLETRGENNLDSKKEGRKSQRRSDIIVKKKEKVEKGYEDERVEVMTEEEDEEKDEDEEEEDEEGCDWIGKLSFRGTLKRLETIELESKALWVGTGIRDLGSWKIRTGYTDQGKLKELRFDKNDDYDRFGKVYYRWKTVGERKFISVNEIN